MITSVPRILKIRDSNIPKCYLYQRNPQETVLHGNPHVKPYYAWNDS